MSDVLGSQNWTNLNFSRTCYFLVLLSGTQTDKSREINKIGRYLSCPEKYRLKKRADSPIY